MQRGFTRPTRHPLHDLLAWIELLLFARATLGQAYPSRGSSKPLVGKHFASIGTGSNLIATTGILPSITRSRKFVTQRVGLLSIYWSCEVSAMTRIIRTAGEFPSQQYASLAEELANELKTNRGLGQPIIEEDRYPKTNAVRIFVLWDRFSSLGDEARTSVIVDAYKTAEGQEFCDRIALASGMTIPEGAVAGLLPYHVAAAVRKSDPVSFEQCRDAMKAERASLLQDPEHPQLRFSRLEDAEHCVERLKRAVPGSDDIWIVNQELSPPHRTQFFED